MAHKYQTFADLLYASYSGLQMLAFAFAKGKKIGGRVVLVALMSCFVLTGLTGFTRLSAVPKSCESCKSCLKNLALLSLKDYRVLCKVCLEVAFAKKKRKTDRFGQGQSLPKLFSIDVYALEAKSHTVCGLLADTPTLASVRKVRHCLAFLYGVGADAIGVATWYDSLTVA